MTWDFQPLPMAGAGGAGTTDGVGASAGVATAAATATSTAESPGASAGVATASATSTSTAEAAGATTASASAAGVGASTAEASTAAAGVATVAGTGSSTAEAVGASAGIGAASAVGDTVGGGTTDAAGASAGVATATATATSTAEAVGASAGTATVAGVAFIEVIAYQDYVGVVDLVAAYRYRGDTDGTRYRGACDTGVEYVGAVISTGYHYRGRADPAEGDSMFEMKVGDRSPSLTRILRNAETGDAVNLTTASGVTVRFRIGTGAVKTGTATVVTAASGIVRYDWAAGDLDAAGTCQLEFIATFPTSLPQTFPSGGYFEFPVQESLAS